MRDVMTLLTDAAEILTLKRREKMLLKLIIFLIFLTVAH